MQNAAFVQEVVELTNRFRNRNGLNSLSVDIDLTEAAQDYSENMAVNDFFSHIGPDGSRPWDRAQAAGYETGIVGENIGVGYRTPEAIVEGWINSPSHRAAMLNPRYNEIGVGYYYLRNDRGDTNYNTYWTQLFGQGEIEAFSPPGQGGFDPLQYGASYPDLLQAYGYNPAAFSQHYYAIGMNEGRQPDLFDEVRYLASHNDLLNAFGADLDAATRHYLQAGHAEGRSTQFFVPLQYLASHDDLINAFGFDPAKAALHFVQNGYGEGRSRDRFDELTYLASNRDLIQSFGYDPVAATEHYIKHGMSENRSTHTFDANAYLAKYSDLQAVFGGDLAGATQHFIQFGMGEGRHWV